MRIVLPDSSELELPEGATGLDAAAIGPKLAEQAVLVRSNGRVQDLRAPLEDGQPIQILTTRDTDDPDAPSSATRLRTCSRRRFGGSTPESRSRSGRRLRTASTTTSSSPSRSERTPSSGSRRRSGELAEGRSWARRTSHATRRAGASRRREPYKVELVDTAEGDISLYTQGEFTDLCRGPHLQDSKDQGAQADRPRGVPAGAGTKEHAAHADLRHRVLLGGRPQGIPGAHRGGATARPPAARDATRPLPPLEHAPGMPFWHPKGMIVWNARGPAPARKRQARLRRVKTSLLYDVETWVTSGHWEKFRDDMFLVPYGEHRTLGSSR